MTIRERLEQNKRRFATICTAAIALFLVGCILSPVSLVAAFAVCVFGFAVAVIAAFYAEGSSAFRCTRCRGDLGVLVHQMNMNPFGINHRIRYCPFCGVDIDAKDSAAPTAEAMEILD